MTINPPENLPEKCKYFGPDTVKAKFKSKADNLQHMMCLYVVKTPLVSKGHSELQIFVSTSRSRDEYLESIINRDEDIAEMIKADCELVRLYEGLSVKEVNKVMKKISVFKPIEEIDARYVKKEYLK